MTDTTDKKNAQSESNESNGMVKMTLGELGAQLPMGIEVGGSFDKNFAWRKWRMKEEKALGKYREDNPGQSMGAYLSYMIGMMFTKIGPNSWGENTSDAEKTLAITQMNMGDVLYLYIYLRKAALGKMVPTILPCPTCNLKNKRDLNLDDLDVRVVTEPSDMIKTVKLQDGVKIFNEIRKTLKVRPPRWQVMMNPEIMKSNNDVLRTVELFKECVCGAEGIKKEQPVAISDSDIDEMTKVDIVTLEAAIESTPGPQMVIELECSGCKQKSTQMVNYGYESFFTVASQLQSGVS